jgi:hypothetical protein
LRSELDGISKRIRRLVTNLEAQGPDSEIAGDIRSRLEELGTLRAKKQRALEAAEKEMAQVPDPESAEALVAALPLLDVDWELVSDHDFRGLFAALNFEASYEPTKRELTIRVTLVPELTSPDVGRAPLLSVPPAGHQPEGNGRDQLHHDENSLSMGRSRFPAAPGLAKPARRERRAHNHRWSLVGVNPPHLPRLRTRCRSPRVRLDVCH